MPIEIKITAADTAELNMWLDLVKVVSQPLPAVPQFGTAAFEEMREDMAKADDAKIEEPAKKRGRPKKEPEAQPANDEKPTMTAAQAEEFMKGSKLPADEPLAVKPTRDDCMNAMRHVSEKFGYEHTRALLQKFDTPKLSLLPEEKYEAFIKAAYDWKAEVA